MKKYLSVTVCCMLAGLTASAQVLTWPMAGKKPGENILSRPQSYIGKELNFGNLFIGGKEGDAIICPADGIITSVSAGYDGSLTYSISSRPSKAGSIDDYVKAADLGKNAIAKYVCGRVGVKIADGRKIYLQGLSGPKRFISGQKVSAGDTLGFLAYSYKGFQGPSLDLSISSPQGKSSDPMTPFGLKTTFKEPKTLTRKDPLPADKAVEDLTILENAVLEAYPSLDALMGEAQFKASTDSLKRSVIAPVSIEKGEYGMLLRKFNYIVHDSHISRLPDPIHPIGTAAPVYIPSLYCMWCDGTLSVIASTAKFVRYVGKTIISINGVDAKDYVQTARKMEYEYDGNITSTTDEDLVIFGRFGQLLNLHADANTTIKVKFSDGTSAVIPFEKSSSLVRGDEFTRIFNWVQINYMTAEEDVYDTKQLNDSTSYLAIKTFEMNDTQLKSVLNYLDTCRSSNLIIDLRNNSGGESTVMCGILSALADKPMNRQKGGYSMVKKQGQFKTFSHCMNYSADMVIFPEYFPRNGESGFFSLDTLNTCSSIMPDSLVHYGGKLYVMTNGQSYSAATLFPSVLVRNRRGVSVGRETGTAYHFMTAYKFADIQMPNSLFVERIPLVKCVFDTTLCERTPAGRGLIPDYPVPITRNEVMMGDDGKTDVMLDYTLSLIAAGKYLSETDPFEVADSHH